MVQEGDFVKAGYHPFISEIKEDYMDPNLVENTMNQLNAKNQALNSYSSKYGALASQIVSIQSENLKLEQAKIN
jgi:hypothetical protein